MPINVIREWRRVITDTMRQLVTRCQHDGATHHTHTGLVGDAALLVVAGVTPPLLGGQVVRHEGGVTLLTESVMTHHLVLPHCLRHLT